LERYARRASLCMARVAFQPVALPCSEVFGLRLSVTYLLGRFPVRSERCVLEEIAAAAGRDVEARIVAFHRAPDPLPVELNCLRRRVRFLDSGRRFGRFVSGALSAAGSLRAFAERNLRRACLAPAPRCLGARTATFWRRARLARCLSCDRPDILHAQFGHLGFLALPVLELLDIPLVLSFRGRDIGLVREAPAGERRALFEGAERVLARCRDMVDDLVSLGCPSEKLSVMPSGINVAAIAFRERTPPRRGEKIRILHVGRRVPKKGLDDARRAVEAVRGRYPVTFKALHDAPHEDVVAALSDAHIFLLPCRTAPDCDKEGVPNAIQEAMAAGLPILSTRHGGIPECVEHGAGGLLSDEADFDGLLANLEALLDRPDRWAAMGRYNRSIVEKCYDINKLVPRLLEQYDSVKANALSYD